MLRSNSRSNSDLSQKSLQITEDDKFYSRLLSKDISRSNPSFRVYYGVASGAIPFQWETQPGTPKNGPDPDAGTVLPPLTPPPSYQQHKSPSNVSSGRFGSGRIGLRRKRSFRTIILTAVIPGKYKGEAAPGGGHPTSTLPRSPSLSSCSSSVSGGSYVPMRRRRRLFFGPKSSSLSTASSSMDAVEFHVDDEENSEEGGSGVTPATSKPAAVGCLGMARRRGGLTGDSKGGIGFRGCFRMVLVKRALLSVVGHGNGPATAANPRVSAA